MTVDTTTLPLTSIQAVLLTTGLLICLWTYLKGHVDKSGKYRWAESLLETHLFLTATISLVLGAYVLDIGHNILDAKTGFRVDPYLLGYLYHLLKFYEYLDIILSVLVGETKISKYTAFSTIFLPLWSYIRIINRPHEALDWRLQVIADCFFRFASRAVPWATEDIKTEQILLSMLEEGRWYADLVISAFWGLFVFQGQRGSEQAVKIFGQPYKDEATAHALSAAIMLYANSTKRQDGPKQAAGQEVSKQPEPISTGPARDGTTPTQSGLRQSTRRKR